MSQRDRIMMSFSLFILEPVLRNMQRPNLAVERFGVAARHPNLVLEDIGGVFVTFFPDDLCFELGPILAVARMPDVAPVLRRVVRPAANHPDAVSINDRGKPD